jgi:hypothetical protein
MFSMGCAHAATISIESLGPNKPVLVAVEGTLDPNDGEQFDAKVGPLSNAIVGFQSDGGDLVAGIQIGETIRLKGFVTVAPDGLRCASACALAWLGGTRRLMGPGAQIGFHSAYNAASGRETGVGNAIVGAYLNRIGLPYSAVIYITQAAPDAMTWLRISDAKRIGIDVTLLEGAPASPSKGEASAPLPPVPDGFVLESPGASPDSPSSLEDLSNRATNFVEEVFREWSMPNDYVSRRLGELYADEVSYYGVSKTRQAVLADKLKFAKRWPERNYTLRPGTLSVRCEQIADTCSLEGIVDWQTRSAERSASSRGAARFSYVLSLQESTVSIIAESSSVLGREKAPTTQGAHTAGSSAKSKEDATLREHFWTQEQINNMSPEYRARELHAIEVNRPSQTDRYAVASPPAQDRVASAEGSETTGGEIEKLADAFLPTLGVLVLIVLILTPFFTILGSIRKKARRQEETRKEQEAQKQQEARKQEQARQEKESREQQQREHQRREQEAREEDGRREQQARTKQQPQKWWEVLGVSPTANMDAARRAYRSKMQLYHPDRLNGLAPELVRLAEDKTKELNQAFDQAKRSCASGAS